MAAIEEETDQLDNGKGTVDDFEDDFSDTEDKHRTSIGTLAKFTLIMISYSTAFLTMVKLGFWLAETTSLEFQEEYSKTPVFSWVTEMVQSGDWFNVNVQKAGIDLCLLLAFVLQHTLLSSRVLKNTRVWYKLHHKYKIDRPLYMLTTALVLMFLLRHWQRIPVKIWDLEVRTPVLQWIHIVAWASMYGTVLMLDLPEMIGLNQVVIESPTMTMKSPEFQMMLQQQRHMGLVPFVIIFLTYPHMSLDRFILSLLLTWYLCRQWASDSAYEYARDMKHVKKLRLSL